MELRPLCQQQGELGRFHAMHDWKGLTQAGKLGHRRMTEIPKPKDLRLQN